MRLRFGFALAWIFLSLPAAAGAGEGWEIRYRRTDGGRAEEATVRVEGNRLGLRPDAGGQEFILGPEGILVVDHGDRTWGSMTFAELDTALEGVRRMLDSMSAAAREAIEAARRGMSPEDAAALDAKLGAAGSAPGALLTLHPTGERATLAGLDAVKAIVHQDGRPVGEIWTTEAIPLGPLEGPLQRLLGAVPPALLGGADLAALLPGLSGFPLSVTVPAEAERVEALRAERRAFDAVSWTAPPGYARTAIPGLGDLGGGR